MMCLRSCLWSLHPSRACRYIVAKARKWRRIRQATTRLPLRPRVRSLPEAMIVMTGASGCRSAQQRTPPSAAKRGRTQEEAATTARDPYAYMHTCTHAAKLPVGEGRRVNDASRAPRFARARVVLWDLQRVDDRGGRPPAPMSALHHRPLRESERDHQRPCGIEDRELIETAAIARVHGNGRAEQSSARTSPLPLT